MILLVPAFLRVAISFRLVENEVGFSALLLASWSIYGAFAKKKLY